MLASAISAADVARPIRPAATHARRFSLHLQHVRDQRGSQTTIVP